MFDKWRYLPPNIVTLTSLALGLFAIRYAVHGEMTRAAWLVLYAMLLDQVDGLLARVLKARSPMGAELDSFADFVAFGLAPAFFLFGAQTDADGPMQVLTQACALVYAFGAALRLARYNLSAVDTSPGFFRGIPSTLGGSMVAALLLSCSVHGISLTGPPLALLLALLGVLMLLGPLKIPKVHLLMRWIAGRGLFWKCFVFANLIAVYLTVLLGRFPEYVFLLSLGYISIGGYLGTRGIVAPA